MLNTRPSLTPEAQAAAQVTVGRDDNILANGHGDKRHPGG